MQKTEYIRARVEPSLKHNAEEVFKELGLSTTEAITLFYKQVAIKKGLPFPLKIPNSLTKKAIIQAERRKGLKSVNSIDTLFQELDK